MTRFLNIFREVKLKSGKVLDLTRPQEKFTKSYTFASIENQSNMNPIIDRCTHWHVKMIRLNQNQIIAESGIRYINHNLPFKNARKPVDFELSYVNKVQIRSNLSTGEYLLLIRIPVKKTRMNQYVLCGSDVNN